MDNEQLDTCFCVRANNSQKAHCILTPHMMEYITIMADKSGDAAYISLLRNGRLYAVIQAGRNPFELGKSNADVEELHQKFLDKPRWLTDIVDTLRVEGTFYKKEANVRRRESPLYYWQL